MIQHILKQFILVALINMALFVPQYDLVPVNGAHAVSNTIEKQDKSVDSIATLIIESIFGIDVPFPIHEDAHFLEKDFVVKRVIKGVPLVSSIQAATVGVVKAPLEMVRFAVTDTIILVKFFGFIARLHYF